jgi:hypothetical protein
MLEAYGPQLSKIDFSYEVAQNSISASLSFHLTAAEKKGIASSLNNASNRQSFNIIYSLTK